MSAVEIWHNPRCSKSRAALDLLRSRGVDPHVVLYLDSPPSSERIEQVLEFLGIEPRELMRKTEPEYRNLGLGEPDLARGSLVKALAEHPILIERPIVITNERAVVGRPPERVLEVL